MGLFFFMASYFLCEEMLEWSGIHQVKYNDTLFIARQYFSVLSLGEWHSALDCP